MVRYSDIVLDHYRRPRNAGDLPGAHRVGSAGSPQDGDTLRLAFRLDGDRIAAVRFQALGCPAAIAAGSAATELLEGKTVDQALALTNDDVIRYLGGLPASKRQCSVLAEQAVRAALTALP